MSSLDKVYKELDYIFNTSDSQIDINRAIELLQQSLVMIRRYENVLNKMTPQQVEKVREYQIKYNQYNLELLKIILDKYNKNSLYKNKELEQKSLQVKKQQRKFLNDLKRLYKRYSPESKQNQLRKLLQMIKEQIFLMKNQQEYLKKVLIEEGGQVVEERYNIVTGMLQDLETVLQKIQREYDMSGVLSELQNVKYDILQKNNVELINKK